jgi:hypothetical protein
MKLIFKKNIAREICHFANPDQIITSTYDKIFITKKDNEHIIHMPVDSFAKRLLAKSRLARRAFRLDKCNIIPVEDNLVIIRQGQVYHYAGASQILTHTLDLKNCRNVLHQSVSVVNKSHIYFGEYGMNPNRTEVPVYRSLNGGNTWEVIFLFPQGKIKHVHGCYFDPYEDKIWVFSGDFENECHILCADRDFKNVEWIGDGNQIYRTCNAFFEQDFVHWVMDSQLQDSYHIRLDRKTRKIEKKQIFPGPVWYMKKLQDNFYLAATAQETGPGVHDQSCHFMVSKDLEQWTDVFQFEHDGFPKKYFKSGVIGFADGNQTSDDFYIFAEAIKGLDGKTVLCKLDENNK